MSNDHKPSPNTASKLSPNPIQSAAPRQFSAPPAAPCHPTTCDNPAQGRTPNKVYSFQKTKVSLDLWPNYRYSSDGSPDTRHQVSSRLMANIKKCQTNIPDFQNTNSSKTFRPNERRSIRSKKQRMLAKPNLQGADGGINTQALLTRALRPLLPSVQFCLPRFRKPIIHHLRASVVAPL